MWGSHTWVLSQHWSCVTLNLLTLISSFDAPFWGYVGGAGGSLGQAKAMFVASQLQAGLHRVEGTPVYPPHPQPHPTGLLPEVAVAEEAPALAPEVPPEEEMDMEPEPLLPPETAPPPPVPPGGFGDALDFGEGVCVRLW